MALSTSRSVVISGVLTSNSVAEMAEMAEMAEWLTGEDQCGCHLGIHQGTFPDSTTTVKHNS